MVKHKQKPKTGVLSISGLPVQLEVSDPADWSPSAMGRSNALNGKITLSSKLDPSRKLSTLCHEVTHQISSIYDLGLDEHTTVVLAQEMYKFIKDNQDILFEMLQEIKRTK